MLDLPQFRAVLASPELRAQHGLDLPAEHLNPLLYDVGRLDAFYQQWTAQGQPRYVPAAAPAAPVAPAPDAPAAPIAPTPPVAVAPVAPVDPAMPAPVEPTAEPTADSHYHWTWTNEHMRRVDVTEASPAGLLSMSLNSDEAPLTSQLTPEQQQELGQAIGAVENLEVVKLIRKPGLVATVGGFGFVFFVLLFTGVLALAHVPTLFYVIPAICLVAGLVTAIRGVVALVRG